MNPQIIQQGAEAIITLNNQDQIQKNRIKKSYRFPILDSKIRKSRTKSESKIINKLQNIIPVPKIIETDDKEKITMEFIDGKKLSEHLEQLGWKQICKQIADNITKMHNQNIVHGDLTTSNMIYVEDINSKNSNKTNEKQVHFIDFGLGFHSYKIEDKAVDLHLLKQALEAKHYKIAEEAIKIILANYKAKQYKLILERINTIEKRGRYRGH